MTKDEAAAAASLDRFYLAAALRHRGIMVGVLYLDAKSTRAIREFEENHGWSTFFERLRIRTDEPGGLSETLYSIVVETGKRTPRLPIYGGK